LSFRLLSPHRPPPISPLFPYTTLFRSFVLEEFAQGLDQLHVHARRKPADIMVRLDGHRRAAGEGDALDHIRIERALREEIGAARSEEHTSELQSLAYLVCRLLLEKKKY